MQNITIRDSNNKYIGNMWIDSYRYVPYDHESIENISRYCFYVNTTLVAIMTGNFTGFGMDLVFKQEF